MSLVAQALCIVAQNVVRGRTWAKDDVLLQPVYPIADLMREGREKAPVIAVYAENTKFDVEGLAAQGTMSSVELKFVIYNAPGVNRLSVEGQQFLEVELDTEQAGLTLNVVARQIDIALHGDVPMWAPCWRKMVTYIKDRDVRYLLIEAEDGVRIPAAEVGYTVQAIPDPEIGVPLYGAWALFDQALKTTAEGAVVAKLFESLIANPAGLPEWEQFRDNFALSAAGMEATGLGPFQGVTLDDGSIPVMTKHTVTGESGPIDE